MKAELASGSGYAALAGEYYDPVRHPTCASFRDASRMLLERMIDASRLLGASCEIGAGASLLAPLLVEAGAPLTALMITDENAEMLAHSREWQARGARLRIASAFDIPAAPGSLDLVVAVLADPYDVADLWSELHRVLALTGTVVLTTPAWEWASRFRTAAGELHEARFVLSTGETVAVPSYVRPPDDEASLIESHGLRIHQTEVIRLAELEHPAPKLTVVEREEPVVRAYAVRHAGRVDR